MIERRGRSGATALEIGIEMVTGTERGRRMGIAAKEMLGLATGAALVRQGLATATRGNRFILVRLEDRAIPPSVQVEDAPKPGLMRLG